ncbi:MAG: flagellar basal body-associated FliL family protein, partial [Bdellovibrionaceae bacterium]|nr:flagellar basal body-associated FliL family protein [Pseudobdellovibrionaceae bacterium]
EKEARLTKLRVSLQVTDVEVSEEIQKSIHKIKDHLIFILSSKDIAVFDDLQKRQILEEEIVTQLNLFLVNGSVEGVQLKKL